MSLIKTFFGLEMIPDNRLHYLMWLIPKPKKFDLRIEFSTRDSYCRITHNFGEHAQPKEVRDVLLLHSASMFLSSFLGYMDKDSRSCIEILLDSFFSYEHETYESLMQNIRLIDPPFLDIDVPYILSTDIQTDYSPVIYYVVRHKGAWKLKFRNAPYVTMDYIAYLLVLILERTEELLSEDGDLKASYRQILSAQINTGI